MRLTGQLLAVFAALSGLATILALWAECELTALIAFNLFVACGSAAFVVALFVVADKPRPPVHGPVLKWGYSEDAIHQQHSKETQ